jgi:hypothetical protein
VPRKGSTTADDRRPKYGLGHTVGSRGAMCFRDCPADVLHAAVSAVVDAGDLIMFTLTTDGGAALVRVVADGVTESDYPATADALVDALQLLSGAS